MDSHASECIANAAMSLLELPRSITTLGAYNSTHKTHATESHGDEALDESARTTTSSTHQSFQMTALRTKNGVGPSTVVVPNGAWSTILEFLVERFPDIARGEWIARMERGDVLDAKGTPLKTDSPFRAHARIYYYRHVADELVVPFEERVLYRNEHLVVADKPHFLPVIPAGRYVRETLLARLQRKLAIELAPLHRIDRETAGLVLFSAEPSTRDRYVALFRERTIVKRYEAIAGWRPELEFPLVRHSRVMAGESFMQMLEATGAPNAETAIEVLEVRGHHARYRLSPVTGRKHQLRVQMAGLGIPILNDRIYPHFAQPPKDSTSRYDQPLQLLAKSLSFVDPLTGEQRDFESRFRLSFR